VRYKLREVVLNAAVGKEKPKANISRGAKVVIQENPRRGAGAARRRIKEKREVGLIG